MVWRYKQVNIYLRFIIIILTIIIINMATTASLELINPYAKFGLKRRPTYEEIVGLIGENDLITGKLPNRDATFFKASPQGSFLMEATI